MIFPRLVYKSAHSHKGVNSMLEYSRALKDEGYFGSVPEALNGVHAEPVPTPKPAGITVFKEPGPSPDVDGISRYQAADQAEVEALIAGDGWFANAHEAHAAAVATSWPGVNAIPGILADLSRKPKDDAVQYAASIGASVGKNPSHASILEAIKSKLEAGPGK